MEVSQNLDDYFKQENTHYSGYDTVFSCFGTQVKMGEETFIKVDKTYPLLAADIALRNSISQFIKKSHIIFLYLQLEVIPIAGSCT